MKLWDRINAWAAVQVARDDMDLHCPHQPIGSCGRPECDDQVTADYYN
ncbi:hypothetical protein [Microbacterium sp. dk485]|nr:hypothetical protein [Microbacterium sp. dk485]